MRSGCSPANSLSIFEGADAAKQSLQLVRRYKQRRVAIGVILVGQGDTLTRVFPQVGMRRDVDGAALSSSAGTVMMMRIDVGQTEYFPPNSKKRR